MDMSWLVRMALSLSSGWQQEGVLGGGRGCLWADWEVDLAWGGGGTGPGGPGLNLTSCSQSISFTWAGQIYACKITDTDLSCPVKCNTG